MRLQKTQTIGRKRKLSIPDNHNDSSSSDNEPIVSHRTNDLSSDDNDTAAYDDGSNRNHKHNHNHNHNHHRKMSPPAKKRVRFDVSVDDDSSADKYNKYESSSMDFPKLANFLKVRVGDNTHLNDVCYANQRKHNNKELWLFHFPPGFDEHCINNLKLSIPTQSRHNQIVCTFLNNLDKKRYKIIEYDCSQNNVVNLLPVNNKLNVGMPFKRHFHILRDLSSMSNKPKNRVVQNVDAEHELDELLFGDVEEEKNKKQEVVMPESPKQEHKHKRKQKRKNDEIGVVEQEDIDLNSNPFLETQKKRSEPNGVVVDNAVSNNKAAENVKEGEHKKAKKKKSKKKKKKEKSPIDSNGIIPNEQHIKMEKTDVSEPQHSVKKKKKRKRSKSKSKSPVVTVKKESTPKQAEIETNEQNDKAKNGDVVKKKKKDKKHKKSKSKSPSKSPIATLTSKPVVQTEANGVSVSTKKKRKKDSSKKKDKSAKKKKKKKKSNAA